MISPIATYILRRILHLVPVLVGVSFLAFAVVNLAPGDPAQMILQRQTGEPPSSDAVIRLRKEMGLDAPFLTRYGVWLRHAVTGDLGTSFRTGKPVLETLVYPFPNTLRLAVAALLLAIAISLPLGVLAAVRQNSLIDHLSRVAALVGASVPGFLLGYILILFFAVTLRWFPVAGSDGWRHLVLPALTLGLGEAAALTRLTRASMLEVLAEDYVRTARAKGVPNPLLVTRHVLRNALNAMVTLTGIRFGRLLGGAVIIETVFARPGIGKTIVDSIQDRDYPTIQGFILIMGTVFVAVNLIVDLSYFWVDPRVRLPERTTAFRKFVV